MADDTPVYGIGIRCRFSQGAGLVHAKRPHGTVTSTFTIATTNADAMVAQIPYRIPIIPEPKDWPAWLAEVECDPATLLNPQGDALLERMG